jgi:hypothetical protein
VNRFGTRADILIVESAADLDHRREEERNTDDEAARADYFVPNTLKPYTAKIPATL